MTAAGVDFQGQPISESWLAAICGGCGQEHPLDECETRENGEQTEYVCPEMGTAVVIVGPAPALTGYRLRENVVHVPGGSIWLNRPDGVRVEFPAT